MSKEKDNGTVLESHNRLDSEKGNDPQTWSPSRTSDKLFTHEVCDDLTQSTTGVSTPKTNQGTSSTRGVSVMWRM